MSDPNYQGGGQPTASGGLLGWLSGVFGGGTPPYQSAPPPPPAAPPPSPSIDVTSVCPPIDPDPFGSGPIAIVIPRQG